MTERSHETLAYRLSEMITMLNSGDKLIIDELTDKYQVSRRTILRDIEDRLAFLPLIKSKGSYQLEPHYLGQLSFKDIRTFAEISGIQKMYPKLDVSFLREILDHRAAQVYAVKGYFFEDASSLERPLELLKSAVRDSVMVKFSYKYTQRIVAPYQIIHHRGNWYLAGTQEGVLKAYRISRMADISVTAEHCEKDAAIMQKIQADESIWFGIDKTEVVLKVSSEVASHFSTRQLLPEQSTIKALDDGSLLLSSKVTHEMQILPLVNYWIPHLRIVSPDSWQQKVEEGLKGYLS